jgi:DNA-binding response OmpR family regulator
MKSKSGGDAVNSKKILIVDDDASIRKFLRINLSARGYKVVEAEGGQTALDILEKEAVDLILLDVMMPEPDGFEVCRRIRVHSIIPILMLSAREGELDRDRCRAYGANDFITKPFVLRELLNIVQGMLK